MAVISFGLQTGWLSPLQPSLQSTNSPLGSDAEPLTDEQISWIGSLPSITLIASAPLFGFCLDKFGRRMSLLLTTAPNLITYLLLIFANDVKLVYISRIIGGFCSCGGFIVGPIYVSETVMPKWKGTLGGLTGFLAKLGIILSFVFGSYTSYLTLNLMSMSFTVLFLVLFRWIPESPVYLMETGKWLEAEEALRKIWGEKEKERISEEIKAIQNKMCDKVPQNKFHILKQFITEKYLRRGLIIVGGVYTFQMFSGYPAIVRYTVDIFQRAGTTYSSHIAAIFLAVSQLIFSFVGALILDRVGRKNLVVYALILMGGSLATVALYLHLKIDYPDNSLILSLRFLPTIALVCFIGFYAAAFGTVPFVIIPELFSPDTRALASTVLNLWFAFAEFLVVKLFPTLTNLIHLSGSLGVFSVFGFVGALFLYFVMFETKGLDFDTIQRKLHGKDGKTPATSENVEKALLEKVPEIH